MPRLLTSSYVKVYHRISLHRSWSIWDDLALVAVAWKLHLDCEPHLPVSDTSSGW